MFTYILPAADIVLISVLALALYFPRHHRKDMVFAYISVNISVLAVAIALHGAALNSGLGLGLFGVLAIIRLRSEELQQHEVAYYFSSLSLGVIGGLGANLGWLSVALMTLVVAVVAVVDAPKMFRRYHTKQVLLDQAIIDEAALTVRLEELLNAKVCHARTIRLDLVNDTVLIDVKYLAQR
ncbi:MAG: DUF4956 domain-containing protein [Propionibacteriaceae bacterium]|jgi:hypothetical protein|nr:DUF4956 domain-containing protein [Propionibacteriaceae bacterium]